MCFLSRSRGAACLGRACRTIANRFPCSLQEPFFKTIVQRGSDRARERDTAIKELQSYRLAHEGRKTPLAPPPTAPGRTGLDDLGLTGKGKSSRRLSKQNRSLISKLPRP